MSENLFGAFFMISHVYQICLPSAAPLPDTLRGIGEYSVFRGEQRKSLKFTIVQQPVFMASEENQKRKSERKLN